MKIALLALAAALIARADVIIHFSGIWASTAAGFQAGENFDGDASWAEPAQGFTGTMPLLSMRVPTFPYSLFSGLPWSPGALYINGQFGQIEWHGNLGSLPPEERASACAPDGTGPIDLMVFLMPSQAMAACVNGSPHNLITSATGYQFTLNTGTVAHMPEPRWIVLLLVGLLVIRALRARAVPAATRSRGGPSRLP